jgi:UDP-2-acetamido-3-amino-2,3-dideoxy-glucuronate N-acetyltransferase
MSATIHDSADVDARAEIGDGTTVWHLAQVREGASVGPECIIGRGAYVDAGVTIGARSKLQNHALVYAPARLGRGVFVGPGVVFTNDTFPRSITPDGELKRGSDWDAVGAVVEDGASIGARAVVLGGVTVGSWSLVAAGSVVTRDVPSFALVAGVPARRLGWVGRSGQPLRSDDGATWVCPQTATRYIERNGTLEEQA